MVGILWIIAIIMWLAIKVHSCQQSDTEQEDTSYTEYADESSSSIRSWIVGDWRLTTPYGDEIVTLRKTELAVWLTVTEFIMVHSQ
jgi:hypothetical protein